MSTAVGDAEVRFVVPRHDPGLERRTRGVRRERDAGVVFPDEPIRAPRLVADQPAERALALADHEPRGAAELLGDPMRDLRQVVQVQAQVVRPRACLRAPVLDDLEVLGLAGDASRGKGVARAGKQLLDQVVADGVQGTVLAGRSDDRPPRAGGPRLRQGDLGETLVKLARLLARADDVEGVVLEHPDPDPVALRCRAVRTAEQVVVDRLGGPGEAVEVEGAVHHRGDPPAGDRVLSQFEQPGGHLRQASGQVKRGADRRGERRGERPGGTLHGGRRGWTRRRARSGKLRLDGGGDHAGHPARVDELEVGEVHAHVEGDPVVGDAALHAQAERPDLAWRRAFRVAPAAGMAVTAGRLDAERGTGRHERRLQGPDQRPQHEPARRDGHDRIRHQLTGPVIGHLATALHSMDTDPASGELVG